MTIPASRIRSLNDAPVQASGEYVLYWMTAARRPRFNFALEHAIDWACELKKPLVVLEALRVGYPWASHRFHRFVMEGMAANAAYFATTNLTYYPYVEPAEGAGSGLLEAFAYKACLIVTDDFPCFFLPRMLAKVAARLTLRLEAVDANGLLPLALARGRAFTSAYSFRRFAQNALPDELTRQPKEEPALDLKLPTLRKLSPTLRFRWQRATPSQLTGDSALARLAIDSAVKPVDKEGGWITGHWTLYRFVERKLSKYEACRSHPDDAAESGLSPWLHFGHLSIHDVVKAVCEMEEWRGFPKQTTTNGSRLGFWGLSSNAEAFLDQAVTWRELAFNASAHLPDYERYESLPSWARDTLEKHALDPRPHVYELSELEAADTHDPVWNAAQRELKQSGSMHNYMRMLWGKKILEWSQTPRVALEHMIHLNDKYALDGRDPNSYAGIFWILGRYDRPWTPERAIFGQIRYMSSANARRKLRLKAYLERYAAPAAASMALVSRRERTR
jgi:deoxyribodipyrimidine photo-lyase